MSYATTPTFEGNYFGVRRLRTLSGAGHMLGGLGDFATNSYAQAAVASGYNADDINTLVAGGATSTDLSNLINGSTTIPLLLNKLYPPDAAAPASSGGINPAVAPPPPPNSVQTALTTQPSSPNPANTPQSPPGSRLLYTVTYSQNVSTPAPTDFISQLSGALGTYGMYVISSNQVSNTYLGFGSATIQFTIGDNVGHQFLSDAQSVLDSLTQKFSFGSKTGSQIAMVALGGSAAPTSQQPGANQTMTQWFEANWGYLAGGLAAVAIVGIVWGGRR